MAGDQPPILGGLSANDFFDLHWQRKPLLVRQALSNFNSPIDADELAGLALEPEVESRLVVEQGTTSRWELRHGPFTERDFLSLPASHWTLLVQAADLWVPQVAELLEQFNFLPRWRLDDIMISYAAAQGSVGPHFDQYDVFLLQTQGERRWQVGGYCDAASPLLGDTDLRILAEFECQQEWLLHPGDMLYLPPGLAHWGVAQTPGLTYSVGFRSPDMAEMLGELAMELAAAPDAPHYIDPPLNPQMASTDIHPDFVAAAQRQLLALLQDEELIADCFARYMTRPKYPDITELTGEFRSARIQGRHYRNGEPTD